MGHAIGDMLPSAVGVAVSLVFNDAMAPIIIMAVYLSIAKRFGAFDAL